MAISFSDRHDGSAPHPRPYGMGSATGPSTAEILGRSGLERAAAAAQSDRRKRLTELARSVRMSDIDPLAELPDPRLIARLKPEVCLKNRVLPWRTISGRVIVMAASVERFLNMQDALKVLFGPVHLVLIPSDRLDQTLAKMCHSTLMQSAEERTPLDESCRGWHAGKAMRWGITLVAMLASCLLLWPKATLLTLCGWTVATLTLNTLLKIAAVYWHLRDGGLAPAAIGADRVDLPIVSILVPLFRERDIAGALVGRLERLDYPRDKLDICLVLEADDSTTQAALAQTELPLWMRAIKVPMGTLQTKPRALNYALNFTRGSIIGVYDAEDAPDPDQVRKVVQGFAERGPEVACLQGRLDYYNDRSNWLARCFTIEYATWFRIVLPGLEKMGLVVPLGGTTLFFRRDILEDLGGWDAHNVTEDADLGVRLARYGYRTEIIETTTQEEANARPWPWVKQRSRWLKGYAITYLVHMRNPAKLLRDIGLWRFFGVQLLFAGTITQFLMAPLLWSFWLMLFGLPHPLATMLPGSVLLAFAAVFVLSEAIGICVMAMAAIAANKRHLIIWTPTLHFYFPLAALAAYKGVFELMSRPFYWDKTTHGIFAPTDADAAKGTGPAAQPEDTDIVDPRPRLQPPAHPVAAE